MYHPAFQDHFRAPRGQGDLAAATHRGEASDAACGDWMALALRVQGGSVAEARYRVRGCPGAIAVGSALVTLLPGRAAQAGVVADTELVALLGEVPAMKQHALRLAQAALAAALDGVPPAARGRG